MERPKLCYVLPAYSPSIAEHYGHVPRFLEELAKWCDLVVVVERSAGRLFIPGARVIQQKSRRWPWRFIELLGILWALNARGYKRIFVRISTGAPIAAAVVRRIRGGKVFIWRSGPRMDKELGRWRIRAWLFRAGLYLGDRLVTGPSTMADIMARQWGMSKSRICLLSNDVDTERYQPDPIRRRQVRRVLGIGEEEVVVLSVVRISRVRKVPRYIPHIWLKVARERVKFILVGGGEELWKMISLAIRLGLRHHVVFTGAVPQRYVKTIYSAADVFFLPSAAEGFPRVVLEAMSMGLAVVAPDVGGVKEILPPAQRKFVVHRDNIQGLGEALRELIEDKALRISLGKANREWVKKYYDTKVVAHEYAERLLEGEECGGLWH